MTAKRILLLASDHGGFELKESLKKKLLSKGIEIKDLGTHSNESVDYPDYAHQLAWLVSKGEYPEGVLICGTGIGMSIAANKIPGIRAAVVTTPFMAEMAKAHNDANVLCLGGRVMDVLMAEKLVEIWMKSSFEGGRHERRINKISEMDPK